jgi:hypothetical protein
MMTAQATPEPAANLHEELYVPGLPKEEKPPLRSQRTVPFKIHVTVKAPAEAETKTMTEVEAVRAVLERAATDRGFIAELTYQGSKALAEYPLSLEAKAALVSGDVRWVEARLGKLDAGLRTWLDCRLQQEIW